MWALITNSDDLHRTAMGAMAVGFFYSIALLVLSFLAEIVCDLCESVSSVTASTILPNLIGFQAIALFIQQLKISHRTFPTQRP